ncbi:MAG: quinone-interacting membrane-bound oxidoreductase complex subunit QmoC [Longimicrobiales bacterium]|nr:quinone-interacting membrane-bound oxidoreductase complex subunit QmoC [Longimicrobiales bacterium]
MEISEIMVPEGTEMQDEGTPAGILPPSSNGRSMRVVPDLEFIRALQKSGGDSLKKCMQCGNCSAACPLSPDLHPFPRKEMAWALWGLKDRLLRDPDIWLCHHCNDCSTNCPRQTRPGDVLGAVRQQCILHYAFPSFLARWVSDPRFIPVLLAIPAILLGLATRYREAIGDALGLSVAAEESIIYSFVPMFPHWLLNTFFGFFSILALLAAVIGVTRFSRALNKSRVWGEDPEPVKGVFASIGTVLLKVVTHDRFTSCETDHSRSISHFFVFFGFLALAMVTVWVITGPYNPLIHSDFIYPFSFWSPWKLLANIGGLAVLTGVLLMIWERLYFGHLAGTSSYFDWLLVWSVFLVVASGFATEVLHYLRMTPHRQVAYFIHLVFVFSLLIYLPYSKFAHMLYRTTAMVFAERYGREAGSGARS